MVTDEQVRLLRKKRMEGKTQEAAAAAAGMTPKTARRWESGALPSQRKSTRDWRTRSDPFEVIWGEVVPILEADLDGSLKCPTLLREIQRRYPGLFPDRLLRTLQRRVRDWRALNGPPQEVFFQQEHIPGREAAIDFTHGTSLQITINGEPFEHLIFEFKLSFSGWTWVCLAYGETFEALVEGLQSALWTLGGVPKVLRHDNLSAATHELKKTKGRSLNQRFEGVLEHYQMKSSRINVGKAHENGVAEKAHNLLKSAMTQQLILRGSREFESPEAYEWFVREVVASELNFRTKDKLLEERFQLQPLPSSEVPNYTTHTAKVYKWSTIRVSKKTYSVPSRLIGHRVKVRQYSNHLEVYYKDNLIEEMPRLRGQNDVRIDYRHVSRSLVRKPGAFARYRYREELFPSLAFRRAYDALQSWRGVRADVEYVRILHLAAETMESRVQKVLETMLESGQRFDYCAVKAIVKPEPSPVPVLSIPAPDLTVYDQMLGGAQ